MVKISNDAGEISLPHENHISQIIFDLYSDFNKKPFRSSVRLGGNFGKVYEMIYEKFDCFDNYYRILWDRFIELPYIDIHPTDNKRVVLGFSAGLDSVYQAIILKEKGYDVILYHLRGINTYENGQATKNCKAIAEQLGVEYVEAVIKKTQGHQQWPENPLKNQLIMALMIDYCIDNNIYYISLGDDLNLTLDNSVAGINTTDSRELTLTFLDCVRDYIKGFDFLPIEECDKLTRIKKIQDYDLEDLYYSCVQAGRFNKSFHDKSEEKYGIKLFHNNCGCYCRKCAMHNLLLYYGREKDFPKEFIDKCWEVMWKNSYSADYELFKSDLPESVRIKNLFEY